MSKSKKYISAQKISSFLDEYRCNLVKQVIKETQDEYDSYEVKSKNDKLNCVVCGGKYTRSQKCIHDKTKKHLNKLEDVRDMINEAMIETFNVKK